MERDELEAQTRLVREAVEQGALGVSSGLIYEPSRYADRAELIACARAAREAGAARYVSHLRDEGDALEEAVAEALGIGRDADVAVRCSHHKASGRKNWGKVHRTLATIDRARTSGADVAIDAYPYVASWTGLRDDLTRRDPARRGGKNARTPERSADRRVEIGRLDKIIAAELFLDFGVGAVQH